MSAGNLVDLSQLIPVPRLDVHVRNREGTLLVAWAESIFELDDEARIIDLRDAQAQEPVP